MSTTFICWPVEIDADFRSVYFSITGEIIQDNPAKDAEGLRFLCGSSRITPDMVTKLESAFSDQVQFGNDPKEFGWVAPESEE